MNSEEEQHRIRVFSRGASIFFAVLFIVGLLYNYFKDDDRKFIKDNGYEIVIGKITRRYSGSRSAGTYIDYVYEYEKKMLEGGRNIRHVLNCCPRIENRFFPVLVSKKDSDKTTILLTRSDFSYFEKEFPDSLEWVDHFADKD